jgi:uncharacterized peroxidase-related enzyme
MSWIKTLNYEEADTKLRRVFDKVKDIDGQIDNVLLIHSLRPHSLVGHMTLYKNVLHNSNNTLPEWYLESIGVYVSHLNKCQYCVQHHFEGLKRLLNDEDRSAQFFEAVENEALDTFFNAQYAGGATYARKLTLEAGKIEELDVQKLRTSGFSDGEILELNQVISYFNYVNRTVLGLGVNIDGEVLGRSPSDCDDPGNWTHR